MKKVIVKVQLLDERARRKGMKAVSGLPGVESLSMDMKDQKLTVIGDVDPVVVVNKIRKLCPADIVSVGPAKEEKKKEEPKKEEPKKDDQKKKEEELLKAYLAHNPYVTQHYFVRSAEEDPNACVIC
ncbi:heavy metal-associated isoprenylated plant protein 39-like [Alnus glutinosa]|uniref:heavy metal-associated isoprenylated plant protein 39-like n=1 Tax=Alnus glutinosa TaxID=3517 RepID=UPI002D777575|nr:heavy metal-associated isoprenylated plant protein 39-like [Alnus glutinosa]